MNQKPAIYREIDDTRELLASLEGASPDDEDAFGLMLSKQSLSNKLDELNDELVVEASREANSLFNYRIFATNEDDIKMGAIGHALANFQSLFGQMIDAVKNGPKLRATVDAITAYISAFSFRHSYVGSVGLAFTIKEEPMLLGKTEIQQAFDGLFEIAQAQTHEEINGFAKRFGAPVIRKLYVWANDNAKYGVGADMLWRSIDAEKAALSLDADRFLELKTAIGETSDEQTVTLPVSGLLVGIDVILPSFHIDLPDKTTITGSKIAEHLKDRIFEVPKFHRAKIKKTTVVHYAIDRETTSYELLDLD